MDLKILAVTTLLAVPARAAGDAEFAAALSEARAAVSAATAAAAAEVDRGRSLGSNLVSACDAERLGHLLRAGGSPNEVLTGYEAPDYYNTGGVYPWRTLLERAVEVRCAVVVRLLLAEPGLDPNRHVARHPVTLACESGDREIFDLLLADPRVAVESGRTPPSALMIAARHGRRDFVERLLARGADPDVMDSRLRRAEDLAADAGHAELSDLLRRARGAVPGSERNRTRLLPPQVAALGSAQFGIAGGKALAGGDGGHVAGTFDYGLWPGGSVAADALGFVSAPLPVAPENVVAGVETREKLVGALLTAGLRQRLFRLGVGNADGRGFFLQPYVGAGATPMMARIVERDDPPPGIEDYRVESGIGTHVEAGVEAVFASPFRVALDWRRFFLRDLSADFVGARVTWAP